MRRVNLAIRPLVVIGIALSFIGVNPVSATRAVTEKGEGCYVRVGEGDDDYAFDAACTAHSVLKIDDDGEFDFWVYQDHGQSSWRPSLPYKSSYEACYNFNFGRVCGIVKESVSPSGEYKSSFKSN